MAAVTNLTFGWKNNPNAALWSRRDVDPADSFVGGSSQKAGWVLRIPSTVVTTSGVVIQFIQFHTNDSDTGCSAFYCRRSTDKGQTWGTPILVYRLSDYVNLSGGTGKFINSIMPSPPLPAGASLGQNAIVCVFNETTVASGIYTIKHYRVVSTDDGLTWSAAVEITTSLRMDSTRATFTGTAKALVAGVVTDVDGHDLLVDMLVHVTQHAAPGYFRVSAVTATTFTLTSPPADDASIDYAATSLWNIATGNGINDGTGNILFPFDHRYTGTTSGKSFPHVIKYAPATDVWSVVGRLDETVVDHENLNECTIAKSANGTIYMSIRDLDADGRWWSNSTDQGVTWATATADTTNIPGESTNASLMALSDGTMYLAWVKENVQRACLTIAKFTANSTTIANQRTIFYGWAGYNSLVSSQTGELMCAFERAHDTSAAYAPGTVPEQELGIARVPTGWVEEASATGAETNPANPIVLDFWFNESTSGAPDVNGRQIIGQGYDQRGFGQASSSAIYDADDGLKFDGTTNGPPLLTNQIAARTEADFFSPGLGSITYEVEFKSPGGAGAKTIFDNRNAAGNGVTLLFPAISNTRPQILLNDGTTSFSLQPASSTIQDNAWHTLKVQYTRGGAANTSAMYIDDTRVQQGTDNLAAGTKVRGTLAFAVGRYSTTASNPLPANSWIRRLRVTRGEALFSGAAPATITTGIVLGATKPSVASYTGYNVTSPPANAPTATGRLAWLANTWDAGRRGATDYYGGYDSPAMPVIHGQGMSSYRDYTLNKLWKGTASEDFSSMSWRRDSTVGLFMHSAKFTSTAQSARNQLAAIEATFDALQETGTFTILLGGFYIYSGGVPATPTLWDNCNRTTTNPGFSVWRAAGKLNFMLTGGVGAIWFNGEITASPTINDDTWYFVAIRGTGSGAGKGIKLSYGTYGASLGGVGPLTHAAQQDYSFSTAGDYNSTIKPTFSDTDNQTGNCSLGLMNWMLYSTQLTDAEIASTAAFMVVSPRTSGVGLGLGIGA